MNIIVCVKQVPDPEIPPSQFRIDSQANRVVPPPGVKSVVSPFDLNAVELALRMKEKSEGKVTALSVGTNIERDVVKQALAMGADDLVLVEDSALEGGDGFSTAYVLAQAIKKIGEYDIIMCGRQAADWDAGIVGAGLAELLELPLITLVQAAESTDGKLQAQRVMPDGHEVFETSIPCVLTVSSEGGEPRYPSMRGIMAAGRKQPIVWSAADIGADLARLGAAGSRTKLLRLYQPVIESECEIVEGENGAEAGANLAVRLHELRLI